MEPCHIMGTINEQTLLQGRHMVSKYMKNAHHYILLEKLKSIWQWDIISHQWKWHISILVETNCVSGEVLKKKLTH